MTVLKFPEQPTYVSFEVREDDTVLTDAEIKRSRRAKTSETKSEQDKAVLRGQG